MSYDRKKAWELMLSHFKAPKDYEPADYKSVSLLSYDKMPGFGIKLAYSNTGNRLFGSTLKIEKVDDALKAFSILYEFRNSDSKDLHENFFKLTGEETKKTW